MYNFQSTEDTSLNEAESSSAANNLQQIHHIAQPIQSQAAYSNESQQQISNQQFSQVNFKSLLHS
jgi:hypothetical protein